VLLFFFVDESAVFWSFFGLGERSHSTLNIYTRSKSVVKKYPRPSTLTDSTYSYVIKNFSSQKTKQKNKTMTTMLTSVATASTTSARLRASSSSSSSSSSSTHSSSSIARRRFSSAPSSSHPSLSTRKNDDDLFNNKRTNRVVVVSSSSSSLGFTEIAQLGLDLDRNTVGPAVFALAAVSVFWLFYDGSVQTKQLKEELDSRGVDSSLFNKLYELKYIKRALDSGDRSAYDEAEEKIQWQRSKIVVGAGSITEVQKIQKFWQTKGIKVKTLADLDKVEEYMVKKYGGKKSKF
jgi:hypothetical protein